MPSDHTLGELAVRFGCELRGDPDVRVNRIASLDTAQSDAVAFFASAAFKSQLATTRAGAVVLDKKSMDRCPVACLIVRNPHATFARIASLLHPQPDVVPGVHASAVVDQTAVIASTASIGAQAVIEAGATIGERVTVGPGCIVMRDASISSDTRLIARVTICHGVRVGERCVVHPGAVLGSDGFGNANDGGEWLKVPQIGSLQIGNDVEIGSNTTIDRGALGDTVIEDGVRLDNLVQIGHNVRVGAHTAMAAGVGIAGSSTIGKHCLLAGKVGVTGHVHICDGVILGGRTTVAASIDKPGHYLGTIGMQEARQFRRNAARFRHLDELAKQLRQVQSKLGLDVDTDSESPDEGEA